MEQDPKELDPLDPEEAEGLVVLLVDLVAVAAWEARTPASVRSAVIQSPMSVEFRVLKRSVQSAVLR